MVAPRFSNPEGGLAEIVEKAIARMGNALVKELGSVEDEWGTDAEAFNVCNCFP